MTERISRRLLADCGVLVALVGSLAVPLIAWRGSAAHLAGWPIAAFAGCWLATLAAWLWSSPPVAPLDATAAPDDARPRPLVTLAVAALLFTLTLVAYYLPLRVNFWGGADEFANFQPECATVWSSNWDVALGRPLVGLPTFVALLLRPGRVEGFLWVGTLLCFANGWLLMAWYFLAGLF